MTPLKKYIRPGVLRNFLRKAYELVGRECPLAIGYEGEVVIVEGTDSFTGFDENQSGVISASLQFNNIHTGKVLMRVPSGYSEESRTNCERVLKFTTYSIQGLIDMERADRKSVV